MIDTLELVMGQLKNRAYYSPDLHELEQFEEHLLFVDNNLKMSIGRWSIYLSNAKFLGSAVTLFDHFIMKRTVQFPITFENKTHAAHKKVLGDLWAIDPLTVLRLDVMHNNGDFWYRKKVPVKCLDQDAPYKNGDKRPIISAWMYLGDEEHWENTTMVFAGNQKVGKEFVWHWNPKSAIGT